MRWSVFRILRHPVGQRRQVSACRGRHAGAVQARDHLMAADVERLPVGQTSKNVIGTVVDRDVHELQLAAMAAVR